MTTFGDALEALCLLVDEQASGLLSGVLVLDQTGRRWQVVATPGLPDSWSRLALSAEVTPTGGACGAAVHERRQVSVTDFSASRLYPTTSLHFAQAIGLQACWATPFFSQAGRVLGVVAIYCPEAREPTDRERRVMARIAHLAGIVTEGMLARVAAENATRQRDHVLRVVAHELGSPLSTIGVCVQVLARTATSSSDCANARDLIDRCVASMHRLIRDLTDVASIESGRLALTAQVEAPGALLTSAAEMFAGRARLAGVALETRTAPDLPAVRADAQRVIQVLGNLVTNALKHTPSGGRITLHAELGAAAVRFAVEDTGSGIAPEELPHLFDRFWHGRRAAQRGSGLGLPIVRGIVQAHGGAVDVSSTDGEGSRFGFTIPIAG
jgi:signal transduction histidine kinase